MTLAFLTCEEPKLDPFDLEDKELRIKWGKLLCEGLHGCVCEVVINGHAYALKMFKFANLHDIWPRDMLHPVPKQTIVDHGDTFFCECRAYGRLKQHQREDVAVRCHGYLLIHHLPPETSHLDFSHLQSREQLPIRCLVKDLVRDAVHFLPSVTLRMMRDLKTLGRLGILVYDIKADAYLNGKISDLSQAHIVPHFRLLGGGA